MVGERNVVLGVIGGSGVYQMENAKLINEHYIDTPFGKPSDSIMEAEINGKSVYFLPRHARGHKLLPTEVPYRANIYAFKKLGVTHVMSVSAVGIMQEHIKPGDMVVPDQLFDRTKGIRNASFFGGGCVGHIEFADPFCQHMRTAILSASEMCNASYHDGGGYVCIEGPQFSTRAESRFYRSSMNPSTIGMTAIPEAKLCREAEMCYGMLALATDYDCWHESEEDVSVEAVLAVLRANSKLANDIVAQVAEKMPVKHSCKCHNAGQFAIITAPEAISPEAKKRLSLLYGKYWN
ncbi:MAG: S-methyl-5'-thioadenosine phosphorylase [Bdellovibrionota bacterium]